MIASNRISGKKPFRADYLVIQENRDRKRKIQTGKKVNR